MPSSDYSADESGYVTERVRRDDPNYDDYDPSEHSYEEDTADSSTRSSVPVPVPPLTGEGTSRGPRTKRTPRKSVLPGRRVTFTIPSVPPEESSESRSRSRSVTPSPPAIGVPVPRPQGMTQLEHAWVTGMANEVELHRFRLDHYRHSLDDILAILNTQDAFTNRVMEVALDARRTIRRMHMYLAFVIGIMMMMVVVLVWVVMH